MPLQCLLLLATALQAQPVPPPVREPRQHALRVQDALFTIPDVVAVAVLVRDCDGDGLEDLALGRGGKWPKPERIDLVSSRDGKLIRTLATRLPSGERGPILAIGGDFDADGVPDLLLGDPDSGRGRVMLISGKEGRPIGELVGEAEKDRLGSALAFLGDLDGDGHDDFAVGAGQFDHEARPQMPEIVSYSSTYDEQGERRYLTYSDGRRVTQEEHDEHLLRARATSAGFVCVRSGKDRTELWRVSGDRPGHAFGSFLRAVGDLDGDHKCDLLVQSDLRTSDPLVLLSGATGKVITRLAHKRGFASGIGDLDKDGVPDLVLENGDATTTAGRQGKAELLSGKTRTSLGALSYPDMWSDHGITVAMGDLDGDGHGEIGFGEANFHLRGPGDPGYRPGEEVDLEGLPLDDAMSLVSNPWNAFTWESGCAIVYSGRTRRAIFGAWAQPGSREGLGLTLTPLPDVSGDGWPDVLVGTATTAYVFRGPGAEPE